MLKISENNRTEEISSVTPTSGKLRTDSINNKGADELDTCVARLLATTVLTMRDKRVLVFHEEIFQLRALSHIMSYVIQLYR